MKIINIPEEKVLELAAEALSVGIPEKYIEKCMDIAQRIWPVGHAYGKKGHYPIEEDSFSFLEDFLKTSEDIPAEPLKKFARYSFDLSYGHGEASLPMSTKEYEMSIMPKK